MKPTFEEVSKKCPWATQGVYFTTCDAQSSRDEEIACLELNCAVWQMVQATKEDES